MEFEIEFKLSRPVVLLVGVAIGLAAGLALASDRGQATVRSLRGRIAA